MGGGLSKFLPVSGSKYGTGNRLEQDLVEEWIKDKAARNVQGAFVTNVTQLKQVDETKTDYLLGKNSNLSLIRKLILKTNSKKWSHFYHFFIRFIFSDTHELPFGESHERTNAGIYD